MVVLSWTPVFAAAGTTDNATGSFAVTVGGNSVTINTSNFVYMSTTSDDTAATTTANVATIHQKGNRQFGMDSDGGPTYYSSVATGGVTVTCPAAIAGNEFSADWTAL